MPLVVYEPLRLDYRWASDRLHRFVLDGMADTRAALAGRRGVAYFPWVEATPGAGMGLLDALAARARVVVTDDYPAFMLPAMAAGAASRLDVAVEAVDGNGLLPMRAASRSGLPHCLRLPSASAAHVRGWHAHRASGRSSGRSSGRAAGGAGAYRDALSVCR